MLNLASGRHFHFRVTFKVSVTTERNKPFSVHFVQISISRRNPEFYPENVHTLLEQDNIREMDSCSFYTFLREDFSGHS